MSDLEKLLAAKAKADGALADAETVLLERLADAKAAYREDRSEKNKAAKAKAVEDLQAYRAVVRSGRGGVSVGGDAVRANEQSEG